MKKEWSIEVLAFWFGVARALAPKYLYTVESPFEGKNLQSLGHAKYLLNFGLKVDLKNPYGSEEINVQKYSTSDKHKKGDDAIVRTRL